MVGSTETKKGKGTEEKCGYIDIYTGVNKEEKNGVLIAVKN